MSEIKNDAMALRNRPLIKGVLAHQIEECIASAASVRPSLKEFIVNCSDSFRTNFCTRHATLRSGQEGSSDPDYRQSVEIKSPVRTVRGFLDDESLRPVAGEVALFRTLFKSRPPVLSALKLWMADYAAGFIAS